MLNTVKTALKSLAEPNLRNADLGSVFSTYIPINSKVSVAKNQALMLSAFYNGVDIISKDIAKLPKAIYKKEGDQRFKSPEHHLHYIIADEPNTAMSSFKFHQTMQYCLMIKGNAYAEIRRNSKTGFEEALVYLEHDRVRVFTSKGKVYYDYKGRTISSENMIHLALGSENGIVGESIIYHAAANLGIHLEAQNFAKDMYANKGLGYGVMESDKSVKKEKKKEISDAFSSKMAQRKFFNVPFLDEGMKYKSITLNAQETDFIKTHAAGIQDVCRWLNLYPHKLKDLSNANFSNVYQMEISHVQDSMLPYVTMWEQEYNRKLFHKAQGGQHYVKFNINALLRASLKDKAMYYSLLTHAGILKPNEPRAWEDLNPVDGLDDVLIPQNSELLSILLKTANDENKD